MADFALGCEKLSQKRRLNATVIKNHFATTSYIPDFNNEDGRIQAKQQQNAFIRDINFLLLRG